MREVRRIIVNFPTNIGDTLLTLPAVDRIRANYPQAELTAIASPRTADLLVNNSCIDHEVFFDKRWRSFEKLRFCRKLRGKFDLIIDFKNSMLPIFLGVRKRTAFIRFFSKDQHSKDRYLKLVEKIAPKKSDKKSFFYQAEHKKWGLPEGKKFIFVAPFSLSARKEYPTDQLIKVIDQLKNKFTFVLLGLAQDREKVSRVFLEKGGIDLTGKTTISDLYHLLSNYASCVLGVDSSILHMASYLNLPIVALFGPTSSTRYGPYSSRSLVLKNSLDCYPCPESGCVHDGECMRVDPETVSTAINDQLSRVR